MRKRIFLLAVLAMVSALVRGQSTENTNYYVVIGAFARLDNAVRFTDRANKLNFSAQYAINPLRKLHYVYLLATDDKRKAYAFAIKMRVETDYKDCWVFHGNLGNASTSSIVEKPVVKLELKPLEEKAEESVMVIKPVKKDSIRREEGRPDSAAIPKPMVVKPEVKKPAGKPFLFKLVNAESGNELTGEVHLQEAKGAAQYQAIPGNSVAYLKAPINKAGQYTVTTQVPGYQQVTVTFIYTDAALGRGDQGELIIPIELKKAKAGNYIDFNHVRFVRNSAILTAESQNELDGLVALMKEDPRYKIKIHGHCNGKKDRDIVIMGTSKKFFAMDPSGNKKILSTTAKVLTEERANTVKAYLVSQGIEEGRIGVKAEGGRIPIYPENSTFADQNDRVEIEIKKE